MPQQVFKNMFNRKHCASHTALRACQLLHDSQKRGMSTKYFFSGRKRNRTISLNFCLVLGDRRKRTHIVGKEVIRRVSKQIGEDRVYKTAKFWGYVLYAWTFIKYILKSFEVLYTLYNDSKKILWTKYLLLIASFEQFNHKKCS